MQSKKVFNTKRLKEISTLIIDSNDEKEETKSAKLLSTFFNEFQLNETDFLHGHQFKDTTIKGGIALSSANAGICIDDYIRTARFLKGIYSAIKELLIRFPDQKINILYAGCGPYATLILPLLTLFNTQELKITLLDINDGSIMSIKKILSILHMEDEIHEVIQGDAITYKKPESLPLHMVITETMFNALTREPQVAITANLAPQIISNGILIPEEITIDLVYTHFSKEPYLKIGDNDYLIDSEKNHPERHTIDTILSMNKNYNFSDNSFTDLRKIESTFYKVPENFNNSPDICLFTKIKVFKNIEIGYAQSYITNPHCITSLFNMNNFSHFKLVYDFKEVPSWNYKLKG